MTYYSYYIGLGLSDNSSGVIVPRPIDAFLALSIHCMTKESIIIMICEDDGSSQW